MLQESKIPHSSSSSPERLQILGTTIFNRAFHYKNHPQTQPWSAPEKLWKAEPGQGHLKQTHCTTKILPGARKTILALYEACKGGSVHIPEQSLLQGHT